MADETLVTIPGATAHHILGQSSVTLGAGDLNLLPASAGSKHDLMLTVGSAGFSLHHDTTFGTLEGDSRAYVFSPEIEGVKGGFVKITLPEGVEEDSSRLSSLQTKFEQVLITHGLLQPAGNDSTKGEGAGEHHATQHVKNAIALGAPESLVTISRCIAAQILGEDIAILSEGTLTLVVVPKSGEEEEPVLTLTVGKSAFPLYKDTLFGTLANDSRTYVFKPVSEGTKEGFVAIVLPEPDVTLGASPDLTSLQNELELVLVEYGLLKDGFGAAADEVARSIREDGTRTAQRIRGVRLRSASAELSHVATNISHGAERGMQSLADVAHGAGGAVLGVAFVAGALVTNALAPQAESTGQLNSSVQGTTNGTLVGKVVGEVKDVPNDVEGKATENDHGKEGGVVASQAGQDVDAPSSANAATRTSDGPSFATGVVRTSSEDNGELRGHGGQPGQEVTNVVDTGML